MVNPEVFAVGAVTVPAVEALQKIVVADCKYPVILNPAALAGHTGKKVNPVGIRPSAGAFATPGWFVDINKLEVDEACMYVVTKFGPVPKMGKLVTTL
jgi:hypothetical protein